MSKYVYLKFYFVYWFIWVKITVYIVLQKNRKALAKTN